MSSPVQEIFAQRLKQARTMRGLSLRSLESAIAGAVSHNALAKYEKGEMMPGSETLIVLADALKQSIDFFFRPFSVRIDEVRFRKKATFPVKRQDAVRELAADFVERYRETEELADDVRAYEPPFAGETITGVEQAEDFANRLRKKWNLGTDALPNVHELLESKGIKVFEMPAAEREFDGLSAETDVGPVIVIGEHLNKNLPRKRMTEVHELGHIVLPFPENFDEKLEEKIVAAFAGAFLLPKESFIEAFGQKRQRVAVAELAEIKAQFGVSMMGIMKRAQMLGLISESTHTGFCIRANQWGWRKTGEWYDEKWTGSESDGRFRQLVRRAVAEEQISLSKGAALLNVPLPELRRELESVIG